MEKNPSSSQIRGAKADQKYVTTSDSTSAAGTGLVADPPSRKGKGQAKAFNFRRPNKFNRDHFRAFQIVHETFARQISTILSTTLRSVSAVAVANIEECSYSEFVEQAENPSFMALLQISPLPGASLFYMPQQLAMGVVERLLGGAGEGPYPSRGFTDIESILMRDLTDRAMRELTYSYESLFEVHAKTMQLESNPQFAQIAAPSDMVLLITFDMKVGATESVAQLCVPYSSMQHQLDKLNSNHAFKDGPSFDVAAVARAVEDRVLDVPIEVNVLFNEVIMSGTDILDIAVGDVLPLGHPIDAPLTVKADGVPHLLAKPGRQGKRLACQVVDSIEPHAN